METLLVLFYNGVLRITIHYFLILIRQKCKQYILKWDAVGSILKQTKRKHQLTIKTYIKYVDKKSPAKNLQISVMLFYCPFKNKYIIIYSTMIITHNIHTCCPLGTAKGEISPLPTLMYATTRYNFVRLKATHKISP
jgi:hypothetical protein